MEDKITLELSKEEFEVLQLILIQKRLLPIPRVDYGVIDNIFERMQRIEKHHKQNS